MGKDKKKKGLADDDYMSMLAGDEAPATEDTTTAETTSTPSQSNTESSKNNKNKKDKKKKNDDYESMIAGNDTDQQQDENASEQQQPKKAEPKKQENKKDKKKKGGDDYLSMIAAEEVEIEEEKPAEPKEESKKDDKKNKKEDKKEDKKKDEKSKKEDKKKDEKNKEKKEEKKDEKKPTAKPGSAAASKKAPPKAVAALKEKLEKERLERERIEREEEEKRKELEMLQKLEEQEKRRQEEEKRKEKLKKKQEIEELKKKGLYKSKKQLEEEKRAENMKALMLQMGHVAALSDKKKDDKKDDKTKKEAKKKDETQAEKAPKEEKKKEEKKKREEKKEEQVKQVAVDDDSWEDFDLDGGSSSSDVNKPTTESQTAEPSNIDEPKSEDRAEEEENTITHAAEQTSDQSNEQGLSSSQTEDEKQKGSTGDLRNPICCVLGHVDVGKTKILDKIRSTNVQSGEAGGITQQIGATYVPIDAIKKQTFKLNESVKQQLQYNLPGLLIIDTPGHESFNNLRTRGSSLCDIAILVIDIMHGLERQTIESLQLIRNRKTPFIVALNKVDALYEWKATPNAPIRESLKNQKKNVIQQFEQKLKDVQNQLMQHGINSELYFKNKDFKNCLSLVPTSAHTGEGIPDLLALMCQLTQKHMVKKLTYKTEIQCTILEVKVIEGHGTTIDVILSNGILREGDTIVVCGLNGPIVTQIRALLTPKPLREIRVKGEYIHCKEVKASMGIKISAQDLDGAVPGSNVLVYKPGDNLDEMKKEVMADLNEVLNRISTTGKGVFVQASTLGSLEALLEFLKSESIPVCGINIGPVHKKDIIRTSVMLETAPEYAVLLAFDVKITQDAKEEAEKLGITIFSADIIYHLFDRFKEHKAKKLEEKKLAAQNDVVWPCVLRILPDCIFHKKDPITVGVEVIDGTLKIGTPIVVPTKDQLVIGKIASIEHNKQPVKEAEKSKQVAVSIDSGGKNIAYEKHFDHNDLLYSKISRRSIDLLKELYPEIKDNKNLLVLIKKLKDILNIP
ncbi:hypothetical protein C9374_002305 [Naegleria lovaniensis]|uniref:Eukaryotic translation initiation factor 5B n=1 Tax=Naegleria lovaniensis TaxID=51637 RepID=A0AA88KMJ4_NAELO|nr:uncharacterized protein C9374_002305 [Naegleria lovaniensis]KAG2386561.1 hypothetical protein C9374_002305 [Naegleria lovaniensis]